MIAKSSIRVLSMLALLWIPEALASQAGPNQAAAPPQEQALTNLDVVKLAQLELGDDIVIAKIKQAEAVAFDLTTDGLLQLKRSKVSGPVIKAMLERATPPQSGGTGAILQGQKVDQHGQDVRLLVDGTEIRLPASRGDFSATGMWPVVMTYLDYPGLRARHRTTNIRPTVLVRSEHHPVNYYHIARLDVNEKENNRSLKIEQKGSAFTETSRVVPAGRWHIEYDASEASPGIWHLVPRSDLTSGEYGVVVPGGLLYEFGVD